MNVEAQAIKVPTGLQDYRPAMYGGIAALELGAHGLTRVPLGVDPLELQRRIVLCYTGAPRNSGTNNWEITKRHIDGDRARLRLLRAHPRHRGRHAGGARSAATGPPRRAIWRRNGRIASGWRRASRRRSSTT